MDHRSHEIFITAESSLPVAPYGRVLSTGGGEASSPNSHKAHNGEITMDSVRVLATLSHDGVLCIFIG